MLFSKRKTSSKTPSRIDSLIGVGTRIEGDITFQGGLRIDGEIRGNIQSAENDAGGVLVIGEQAMIEGEINCANLVISGSVLGPVRSTEFLELQPTARVTGDVQYYTLEMHLGAVVHGQLSHAVPAPKPVELKVASGILPSHAGVQAIGSKIE